MVYGAIVFKWFWSSFGLCEPDIAFDANLHALTFMYGLFFFFRCASGSVSVISYMIVIVSFSSIETMLFLLALILKRCSYYFSTWRLYPWKNLLAMASFRIKTHTHTVHVIWSRHSFAMDFNSLKFRIFKPIRIIIISRCSRI